MNELEDRLERALAARTRSVVAGPPRLESALRRRRRRTRVTAGGLVLLVAAGAASTVVVLHGPSRDTSVEPSAPSTGPPPSLSPTEATPSTLATTPAGPPVGTVPLGAYGLAVLADPGAEVLDVTDGRTARLAAASTQATAIGISPDGRYIAATVGADQNTVEILDRDDRVVWSGAGDVAAWSPVVDTLALAGGEGIQLVRVSDDHAGEQALGPPATYALGIAWRPDGSEFAVGGDTSLRLFGVSGQLLGSLPGAFLDPVTWTDDGTHLLLFQESDSSSLNADGVSVLAATVHGGRVSLGVPLGEGVLQVAWWHPTGGANVLGTLGAGREVNEAKRVVRCDLAAGRCATLAGDEHTSAFDAVTTASGIAYLTTRASPDEYGGTSDGYALTLADADGAQAEAAPRAPGTLEVLSAGDTLLLDGFAAGRSGIFRYAFGVTTRLTVSGGPDSDDFADYYGQDTEIVAWRPDARPDR